jgi:hypothetical protein
VGLFVIIRTHFQRQGAFNGVPDLGKQNGTLFWINRFLPFLFATWSLKFG